VPSTQNPPAPHSPGSSRQRTQSAASSVARTGSNSKPSAKGVRLLASICRTACTWGPSGPDKSPPWGSRTCSPAGLSRVNTGSGRCRAQNGQARAGAGSGVPATLPVLHPAVPGPCPHSLLTRSHPLLRAARPPVAGSLWRGRVRAGNHRSSATAPPLPTPNPAMGRGGG
jgi:hypothetical protein